jgi:hypothetical protein
MSAEDESKNADRLAAKRAERKRATVTAGEGEPQQHALSAQAQRDEEIEAIQQHCPASASGHPASA